ncbi:MAG: hypothetical protein P8I75_05375 [Flavobacteriaceae bacterium]|nr:hypothetical protein [Flavobacteriaceae bacterium]MDG1920623.1 hypothetical protein [Flavobacteriaceae bacterium]
MKKFVVFVDLLGFTLGSCEKDENTPILIPSSPGNDGGTALHSPNPSYPKVLDC